MYFEKNFFEAEYRSGFFVDSRMKHFWAASIETLEEIDKVCKKHGITWYAADGTLLGAVRHKGFIPWDDDIDIAMKRVDYEKFLRVAPQELPEYFMVCSSESETNETNNAIWVSNWNNQTIFMDKQRLIKYHGCPFGVGIDIFPLDYICRDKAKEDARRQILTLLRNTVEAIKAGIPEEQILRMVSVIETILQKKVPEWDGDYEILKRKVMGMLETVYQIFSEEESDEIGSLHWLYMAGFDNAHFRKECYEDVLYMPFEGYLVPAPVGYDEILRGTYGDYMTPVRGTSCHTYPIFKDQLKHIEEWKRKSGDNRELEEIVAEIMSRE